MARYEDAAEQFRLAAKAAPKNALVYYSLGGTYIYQGKYTEAIGALKQSIRLRPSQAAYANLGQAYLHVRRYKDAIDAYEHATALDENAAVLYTLYSSLADAYYWAGMRDKAMPAYRRSIELADQQLAVNPDNTDVHTIMAFDFAALGDKPLAESHLRSALKSGAHDPEILFYAARVHQRLNDTSEALQWLKKATAAGYSTADINAAPEFDAVRNDRAYLDAISAGTHATHAQR